MIGGGGSLVNAVLGCQWKLNNVREMEKEANTTRGGTNGQMTFCVVEQKVQTTSKYLITSILYFLPSTNIRNVL